MITDKELETIAGFWLDKETKSYIDGEDYAIVPLSKNRMEWDFCYCSCVDGTIDPIFRIEKTMTMEDFSEMYYLITHYELIFKDDERLL